MRRKDREVTDGQRIREIIEACSYTARFQCVMGGGRVSFLESGEEKRSALRAIMRHHTGREEWTFEEPMLCAVCVFQLEVEELSCKEHL